MEFKGFDTEPPAEVPEEEREVQVGTVELPVGLPPLDRAFKKVQTNRFAAQPKERESDTEQRPVFVCPSKFHGEPYYLTHTHNRVLVVDPDRITFFHGQDPAARRAAERRREEEARALHEKMERERQEAAARAKAEEMRPKHDAQIGTILVQNAVPRRCVDIPTQRVMHVFVIPELGAAATDPAEVARRAVEAGAPPYFTLESGKRVVVRDISRIRFRRVESEEERHQREKRELAALGDYAGLIGPYELATDDGLPAVGVPVGEDAVE